MVHSSAGHVIEDLGDLTNIAYPEYKAIWPVSGRDFCIFNAIRVLSDDTYVMAARSVSAVYYIRILFLNCKLLL